MPTNFHFKGDPDLAEVLPINTEADDVYEILKNGIILW